MWSVDKLDKTVVEAKRFLEKAEELKEAIRKDKKEVDEWNRKVREGDEVCNYKRWYASLGKERAALKRASMDLTRALAEYRK